MQNVAHGNLAEERERNLAIDVVQASLLQEDAAVLVSTAVVRLTAPLVGPRGVARLEKRLPEHRRPLAFFVQVVNSQECYVGVGRALDRA